MTILPGKSMGRVLALNADLTPAGVISVERALVLIYQQKVVLVHDNPKRKIRSAYADFLFPSVVRLTHYQNLPFKKVPLTKRNILRRDDFKCQYCGSSDNLTVDHVLPQSRGGRDEWTNLAAACRRCNNAKNDQTPEEAGMTLARKPARPNHLVFLKAISKEVDPQWEQYLFS